MLAVVSQTVTAAIEQLASQKKSKLKELFPANQSITEMPADVVGMGEGGETGVLTHEDSVTFAVLEVFAFWSDIFLTSLRGQLNPARCWPCRYADAGSNFNYGYGWYM